MIPPTQAGASAAKDLAAKKAVLAEAVASYRAGAMSVEEARRLLNKVR